MKTCLRSPAALVAFFTSVVLSAFSASAFADSVPYAWDLSTVDPAPTSGVSLGLVVEGKGLGHVAFWTIGVGVRYGTGDGTSWTIETLPYVGTPPPGMIDPTPRVGIGVPDETNLILHTSVRLAVAPDGTPWIAQIDHGRISHSDAGPLAIRHRDAGTWVTEWIDVVGEAALDVTANGDVHVAWSEAGGVIVWSRRTGPASWAPEVAFSGGSLAGMQVGDDGTVHVAVRDFAGGIWHVARAPGGGWTPTPVTTPTFGGYVTTDFALDPQGRPAIIVGESDPLYPRTHLRLHRRLSADWTAENVDVDDTPKLGVSLAFDGVGNPLVAYRRDAQSAVVAAVPGVGGWSWSLVDAVGTGNQGLDGEFDATGRPWFANATQNLGVRLALGQRTVGVPDAPTPAGTLRLGAPRPSPARAGATISFVIDAPERGTIALETVDARGAVRRREVRALEAGTNAATLPTRGLSPGVYWVRVVDGTGGTDARRFVIAD